MSAILQNVGVDILLIAKIIVVALVGYFGGMFLERIARQTISKTVRLGFSKSAGVKKAAIFSGIEIGVGEIIGKSIKYSVFLLAIILIFDFLGIAIARDMLLSVFNYMNNITAALLILIIGAMVAEIFSSMIRFSLSSSHFDELFNEAGREFAPSYFISFVFKYLVYLISITIALTQLGFQTMLLTIIVGGVIIIMTLFIFALIWFGLKDMAPDILSGVFIRSSGFVKLGENVEIDSFRGKVRRVGLLATEIKGKSGILKIQNSLIVKKMKIEER